MARLRGELASQFKARQPVATSSRSAGGELELLLSRGIEPGGLVDWLYATRGNGAGTLALLTAWRALNHETTLVVIDPERQFYPPAAAAQGIDLSRMVWVRPAAGRETLWTWEQSLRSPAVGAVWGLMSRIEPRAFRRLQLAAEGGEAVGHLVRPAALQSQPSWAATQLLVEAGGRMRLRVTLTRARQGPVGKSLELEPLELEPRKRSSSHAPISFPVAAAMADSTSNARALGA